MLKLAVAGAVIGLVTAALGDVAAAVVLGVAAATSVGLVWRKVIAPLVRLADLLAALPEWMKTVDGRLDKGHANFEEIRGELEALRAPAEVAAERSTAIARDLDVVSRND